MKFELQNQEMQTHISQEAVHPDNFIKFCSSLTSEVTDVNRHSTYQKDISFEYHLIQTILTCKF